MKITKKEKELVLSKLKVEQDHWNRYFTGNEWSFETMLKGAIHKAKDIIDVVSSMKEHFTLATSTRTPENKHE